MDYVCCGPALKSVAGPERNGLVQVQQVLSSNLYNRNTLIIIERSTEGWEGG